jgi:DNA-binding CsgD family transcriptional regulator
MGGWLGSSSGIVGRASERSAVARFVAAIPSGPIGLAIVGDPGIGKSTLIDEGIAQASDSGCQVLSARPAAPEASMSFAGLIDLLEPVIDQVVAELAPPQREALEVALLRRGLGGIRPDERAVSVAFLSVLRSVGARSPVLLAIDDAHWLDRPTARVVQFAIRRVSAEPVGVLVATRTGERQRVALERALPELQRTELHVGPMSLAELHHVVSERGGIRLARRALLKIHELSGGNPFFAIELAAELERRGQRLAPAEPLPVPATATGLLGGRLARLPARARLALLVASAAGRPTIALLDAFDPAWNAGELLSHAERRGAIEIASGRIRFSHPLVASTVYSGAPESDRRRVHRRLAEVAGEPEQRARHLALASTGPDEAVAAALEDAARIADARGAPDAAAELCELAHDATPPAFNAARRRALSAADHYLRAGDLKRARALADEVVAAEPTRAELARALHLLAKVSYYGESFPEAAEYLTRALAHAGLDPGQRAQILLELVYVTQAVVGFPAAAEHARSALVDAERGDEPGLLAEAMAVAVMADFLSGHGLDSERLERALELEDPARRTAVNLRPSLIAGLIFAWIGELDRALAMLDQLRAWLIESGEEAQLATIAFYGAAVHCWRGEPRTAMAHARETFELAEMIDSEASRGLALSAMATADAYLGNVDDAVREANESVAAFERVGWRVAASFPLTALAFLHLSLDEPAAADRALRPIVSLLESAGLGEPSSAPFLPEEIEALIGIGELSTAESLLAVLQERAERLDRAVSLARTARCRGLLDAARGDLESALRSFGLALEQHDRAPVTVEQARTLLALGMTQRRANKRREAGESLDRALTIFDRIGAMQWAKRTRDDLARLGLRRSAGNQLTPTEEQVASRASSGMTNREIANALFISPKTVEANLARVYRKLGIRSRAELGRQIADRERSRAINT